MELEKIKDIWKTVDESSVRVIRAYEITALVRKKSGSLITTMKKNLLCELFAVIILYAGAASYFFISGFKSIAILLGVLFICFLFYYYMKSRLLTKMSCISCEVRNNLERQLEHLQQYQKLYAWATGILTPLSFIAAWFILSEGYGLQFSGPALDSSFYIAYIFLGVVVSVTTYFLNKIYVRKLYGQHINRLKKLLNEIEG